MTAEPSANGETSRLDMLRRVDAALSESDNPKLALSGALQVLLPDVCQQVTLSVDEVDGSTSLVTGFVDPELERLARDLHGRYPPKPTVHLAEVTARTGRTHVADVTDGLMVSIAHDAEHLQLLRRFGATQLIVIPLRRHGRALGVLAMSTDNGRRFGADDRLLAELVATRLAIHLDTAYIRRRVLVVDDNEAHRYLLARALSNAGFYVREAETGAEALRLVREGKPDVVILDVHLPDMLGFDVCAQLKADEQTQRVPIIQQSAIFVSAEARQSARSHGADDFLIAPVDPGDLVATVQSVLRASDEQTESRRSVARERLARVELERVNARLRAITESGLLGTLEWGSDGVLIDANDAFLKIVGYTREDVLSRRLSLSVLLTGDVAATVARSVAPLVVDLIASDGKPASVLFGRSPTPELHDGGVAFVLDVSEQRRRAELEALLVGIVSHDLRNPLNVVAMAASVLLSQQLTEAQRKLAQRIEAAGHKSARLITDLLDFTVARGAGIQLSPEPRDLHEIVAQAADDVRATWPERVIVHERRGAAVAVMDQARVEQIAANLIGNALQHSPATTTVIVETRGEVDAVCLCVQNQGTPIPKEVQAQLFAPLRRGEHSGHRRGSIGLGLFIVHHLVEAHGGAIDVTSSEAEGTRFTVRLPRSRTSSPMNSSSNDPATPSTAREPMPRSSAMPLASNCLPLGIEAVPGAKPDLKGINLRWRAACGATSHVHARDRRSAALSASCRRA